MMRTNLPGKFLPRSTLSAALLLLAVVSFSARPVAGQQCLEVEVLDPSSTPVLNATVSIGDRKQPTDDAGRTIFCKLGAGSHLIIVSAPGFQTKEESVQQAEDLITFVLQLAIVSEELVVVGTRTKGRDPLESSVPVELVPGERLRRSGLLETGRALQMQSPSFNFSSSSISDGTDALRPATLRGLGPDQVLVLVNGKRRHNSALLHVNTSVGRGTAGTDMNAIPIAAIERIEVLRDGASAQYGSDAIAGVINIVLKNSPGFSMDTSWGQTYARGWRYLHAQHAWRVRIRERRLSEPHLRDTSARQHQPRRAERRTPVPLHRLRSRTNSRQPCWRQLLRPSRVHLQPQELPHRRR